MKYFTDSNGALYSGGDDAEFPANLQELSMEEFEKAKTGIDLKTEQYNKKSHELQVKNIKERYDRLIRNGWNKKDASIESGLDKIKDTK